MTKTLTIGIASYEDLKVRTLSIARGELTPRASDRKVWFPSLESFAKVLSAPNRELLSMIDEAKPQSLTELANLTGRAKSNLSRTLRTMEKYGLVEIPVGAGRNLAPRVRYTAFKLEVPLRIAGARRSKTGVSKVA